MTVSIPSIADSCMLVYCRVNVWSARKLDKKQTQKTIDGAGASSDAARVNKNLLANADALLKEVQRKGGQIRDYLEANTVPWDDAGNRLLPNDRALSIVGKLNGLEKEFAAAVDEFVAEYPVLRAQAVANLGDMGADEDYPQPDVVRSKFAVKISFNPLGSSFGDVRVGMSQQQAQKWQEHYEANVRAQVDDALMSAWRRLQEILLRYSDRLTLKEDGKTQVFRDTMVEGMRQTVSLLASLNVFNNPQLDAITKDVQQTIACFDAEQLRGNMGVAIATKASVDDILKRMQGILG